MISYTGRRYVQVVVAALGMFAMLASAVAVTYVHPTRWDLSRGHRYTLSDHALAVLRRLDQPVEITAFIRTQDPRNPVIKDLLWQAARESEMVDYTVVDINKNPALAQSLGVRAYGATVVQSANKRRDFTGANETLLISAISHVTQPPKTVVAITGHGECDLANIDRSSGCSRMRTAISQEFYTVTSISLVGGRDIDQDVAAAIIAGPRSDFLPEELEVLGRFLDRGGDLLVMLDPFQAPRFSAFLAKYGVTMTDDVILDPRNRLAGGELLSAVISDLNDRHLLSATLPAPPLFSGLRSVRASSDEDRDRVAATLMSTGRTSWASLDRGVLDGASPAFVAGRDINGPFVVGAEISQPAAVETDDGSLPRTRMIVFGDSDFASNGFFDYLGNRDLLVNSVNWLAREDAMIGIRRPQQQPGVNVLFISQAQLAWLFWLAVVVQPVVFFVVGTVVFLWRRFGS